MRYFVYVIESLKDGTYYVGSTRDLSERMERHNQGRSTYTKSRKPWKLVYTEEHPDRSRAIIREREIKSRKSKGYIEALVRASRQSRQNNFKGATLNRPISFPPETTDRTQSKWLPLR